jgi:hypothetical protein
VFGFWKKKNDAAGTVSVEAPAVDAVLPAADAVPKNPVLKLKYGGVRHRVSRDDGEIMIGRETQANILVTAAQVSRHHATIIWDDLGYPLLVNLSKSGTSVQLEGGAPAVVDGSMRLEGVGKIGLCSDFAYAEQNQTVVDFESKWPPRA